ncbi:hypothetical protein LCGC14_1387510 [marine sediment metagenome]|uniref:Uncharacterized protein n=1 Tax=marine sediment metagenome TaxID=412755 RepID=A0A0F9MGG4_9ZZZZ
MWRLKALLQPLCALVLLASLPAFASEDQGYAVSLWKWQPGGAFTIQLPWESVPHIFVKKEEYLPEAVLVLAHERVHVDQIHEMGVIGYVAVSIWARVETWDTSGRGHWIEDNAYVMNP